MADCRAPGILNLNILEDESDLLTSGKDPSGLEEETDLDMAYEELEAMKQRLIPFYSTSNGYNKSIKLLKVKL